MSTHEEFISEALKEAAAGLERGEVPVGCVVVRNGLIIEREHNRTIRDNNPLAHAEFIALQKIIDRGELMESLTFYITIEPCVMCSGVLRRAGVELYFGCYNDIFGTKKITGEEIGVCTEDGRCIDILRDFYLRENPLAPEEQRINKANRKREASS